MAPIKSTEMARRLGVSDSVIRSWAKLYADFLSPAGAGVAEGAVRRFSEDDQLILATVSQFRNEGKSHDEIRDELRSGWRVPTAPPPPDPDEDEFRKEISIVTADKYRHAIAELRRVESELERVLKERDQAQTNERTAQERIAELREQLAAEKTKAEMLERMLDEKNKRKGWFK